MFNNQNKIKNIFEVIRQNITSTKQYIKIVEINQLQTEVLLQKLVDESSDTLFIFISNSDFGMVKKSIKIIINSTYIEILIQELTNMLKKIRYVSLYLLNESMLDRIMYNTSGTVFKVSYFVNSPDQKNSYKCKELKAVIYDYFKSNETTIAEIDNLIGNYHNRQIIDGKQQNVYLKIYEKNNYTEYLIEINKNKYNLLQKNGRIIVQTETDLDLIKIINSILIEKKLSSKVIESPNIYDSTSNRI